ncbi:MAG: glycoside hydrolase 100 family protein [Patescibacteria group bacterium]
MKLTDQAYQEAIKVLGSCAKKTGFYASGLPGGYEATWARDSMITGLGVASAKSNLKLKTAFHKSIGLLAKNQSKHGQIPNAVGSYNTERRSDVTFNSIDSTLWWIIGLHAYSKTYKDKSILKTHAKNLKAALTWLEYQDPNEDSLLVQQPTMDWEDAFPHKYGRVINTEALYYAVLNLTNQKKKAEKLKKIVNGETEKYLALYDKKLGYYRPWVWKSHGPDPKMKEQESWFDTPGNLLAIVAGLATPKIANSILNYIEKNQINRPYPCKAIWPPIRKGDKEWHSYFAECEAREAFHYLNAGIWPFIGGFYVAALVKMKKFTKAKKALELLAKVNRLGRSFKQLEHSSILQRLGVTEEWQFLEWVEGKKGSIAGSSSPYQAWSAGMYLYAHNSLKAKKLSNF